jgi:hypothetical protein
VKAVFSSLGEKDRKLDRHYTQTTVSIYRDSNISREKLWKRPHLNKMYNLYLQQQCQGTGSNKATDSQD